LPEIVLIPRAFFVFHQWLAGWLPCCVQSPKLSYEEEEEEEEDDDDVSQQGSSHGAECDNNKSKHCNNKKKKKWQGTIYDLKQR
jgi:hypothetical protein